MARYCINCGGELGPGDGYCPHCGARAARPAGPVDWQGPLLLLGRGFAGLILGGLVLACGLNGCGALILGGVFFYHFASSGAILLPTFLADELGTATLGGAPLAMAAVVLLFIALVLLAASVSIVRVLRAWGKARAAA